MRPALAAALSAEAMYALAAVLLAGFGYASYRDWKVREVDDTLWLGMAFAGAAGGFLALGSWAALPLGLWAVAAALVIEHLLPWDERLERVSASLPGYVEVAVYAAVVATLAYTVDRYGVGASSVPPAVIAVVVTVLLARALFEVRVLYGGADAKALMVAGLLVPVFPLALLPVPAPAAAALTFYPFSLNLLMDAAILSISVPVGLALLNARRGQFEFPRGFTSYVLPVARLDQEFVWLRDPMRDPEEEEVDTTEDDVALRRRQKAELQANGVTSVWVTPQLPFLILLTAGALAALLVGNLIFDLAATL